MVDEGYGQVKSKSCVVSKKKMRVFTYSLTDSLTHSLTHEQMVGQHTMLMPSLNDVPGELKMIEVQG